MRTTVTIEDDLFGRVKRESERARSTFKATLERVLRLPTVVLLHPGQGHWDVLRELLEGAGTAGNLTTDAHLAALAIEYEAELFSTDNDFVRFRPALRFTNPLVR